MVVMVAGGDVEAQGDVAPLAGGREEGVVDLGPCAQVGGLGGGPQGAGVGGGEGHYWSGGAGAEEVGFFHAVDKAVVEDGGVGVDC